MDGSILVHQKAYTKRVLERFGMANCKAVATPIIKTNNIEDENTSDRFPYRQAVGALAYLMTGTRPDIAYAISVVSRNLDHPTKEDIHTVKRILRYLKGTMDKGIIYKSGTAPGLECYSDADHGGDLSTGRSTTGMLCLFGGGPNVTNGVLDVCKVPAARQLADMLTKPLYGPRIQELSEMCNIKNGGGC